MSTSQTTRLCKPSPGERIPPETLGYFRSRAKRQAYELVIREFQKSGLTQAELARRLGKGRDRISRMLGGPGNWTLVTVSDLLFAICGGTPKYSVDYPLEKPVRNLRQPEWLTEPEWVRRSQAPRAEQPPVAPPPGTPIEKRDTALPKELVGAR
jgi:hypothetical protein